MSIDKKEARQTAQQLFENFKHKGDVTGWFEAFYEQANGNEKAIPWADMKPHALFMEWVAQTGFCSNGERALVVGCGLGDDAEELAQLGFDVTAFDISPTAIGWCKQRFPNTTVNYQVADLFDLPEEWLGNFDFVLEVYTVQALPRELRELALECIAYCIAPAGELLVICRGREPSEPVGTLPWPLTHEELSTLQSYDLREVTFEKVADPDQPTVRHFRTLYRA